MLPRRKIEPDLVAGRRTRARSLLQGSHHDVGWLARHRFVHQPPEELLRWHDEQVGAGSTVVVVAALDVELEQQVRDRVQGRVELVDQLRQLGRASADPPPQRDVPADQCADHQQHTEPYVQRLLHVPGPPVAAIQRSAVPLRLDGLQIGGRDLCESLLDDGQQGPLPLWTARWKSPELSGDRVLELVDDPQLMQ